jgi:hypothetical protein
MYIYANEINEDEIARACSTHGNDRKSVGKKPLGRSRLSWDVNIKIYVKES